MAYEFSPDPNVQRTDTAFIAPQVDWGKEFSMLQEYIRYSHRNTDKDPSKRSAGEEEYLKFIQYTPPEGIIDERVSNHLMTAYQKVVDQATELYKAYNYAPPPDQVAALERNKAAFINYQNQLKEAESLYRDQRKVILNKENAGKYDFNEFSRREELFAKEGIPIYDFLAIAPLDPSADISGMLKQKEKTIKETDPVMSGGIISSSKLEYYKDFGEPELSEYIANTYKKNAPFQQGVIEDFMALPDTERNKYTDPSEWAAHGGANGGPAAKYAKLVSPREVENKVLDQGSGSQEERDKSLILGNDMFYRVPPSVQRVSIPMYEWLEGKVEDGKLVFSTVNRPQEELVQDMRFIALGQYEDDINNKVPMAVFAYKENGEGMSQEEVDDLANMDTATFIKYMMAGVYSQKDGTQIKLAYKPYEDVKEAFKSYKYSFKEIDRFMKGTVPWKKKTLPQ